MKKSSHPSPAKKKMFLKRKDIAPLDVLPDSDSPVIEENLAGEQFSVVGREDEASSSGHRVEPILPDEENNAETLVEDGLHGYLHAVSKKSRKPR
jgi:hypothetical protein